MSEEVKEVVVEEKKVDEMAKVMPAADAPIITMKKCLEAGVHFGHQTRRWNPKMKPYIYTARNGIYIIDLQKSVDGINAAYVALREIVKNNGKVIFVGTKKQCQDIVKEEALRSGSFYATSRWLGGTLTNFRTIQKRIKYLKDIETMEENGTFQILPKKEVAEYYKEKEKLEKSLGGIKEMRRLPQALFVIDPRVEYNAVMEAKKLRIPVFGIVDTNSDPDLVDYVIPANDDAAKSVKLVLQVMADAIVEGKGGDQLVVAYTPDEGEEVTMTDAIANVDKAEAERQAARRAAYEEKQRQMQQQRRPSFKKPGQKFVKKEEKVEAPKEQKPAEEKPVEEKVEAVVEEKKPAKKAPAKKVAEKAEEVKEKVEAKVEEVKEEVKKVVKKTTKKAEAPKEEKAE